MKALDHDRYDKSRLRGWRLRLFEIIFESDTPAGKGFDVTLIGVILLSVVVVMMESVAAFRMAHGPLLFTLEWVFTALFTIEYALRLVSVARPMRYATSFFGIVDLLAIIPTYLSLFVPGAQFLLVIRLLRILRVFRVLKLAHYLSEADVLATALHASRRKITVFLVTVVTLATIMGSLMYFIEGAQHGFTSIPRSIYWAIVTLTTVGYGDISPQTSFGQAFAALIMIMGYGIIAVPTGIVTVELGRAEQGRTDRERADREAAEQPRVARVCPGCKANRHDADAVHCKHCGSVLGG